MSETMSDMELQALVESMRNASLGVKNDTLSVERQMALDYYFGREFGNEIEGRSKVVDRVLMEVVEWSMPQIMRTIMSHGVLARFNPRGPEDVQQAEQETDYINYLILEKNDGYMVLHDAIKDALLLRNGYVKRYVDEYSCPHVENYAGLDEMAVTQLMQDLEENNDSVEVLGQDESSILLPDGTNKTVYDLKLRVKSTKKKICIEAVPSEEMLISPRCRGSLQKTDFVGHEPPMTRADLISMGMDKEFVMSLPAKTQRRQDPDHLARDPLDQSSTTAYAPNNPIMEEVDYLEAYVRVDYDDDGEPELRKVILAGGKIPDGDEWNEEVEEVPFSYGTPLRMPHKHIGISLYDLVSDIQLINSTLDRQMLDNVYLSNNQRPVVNERVALEDILVSAPGAPIRVKGEGAVQDAMFFQQPTPIMGQIMPVLDYWDSRKEQRTGIGRNNTIIDPRVMRDSSEETVASALNAANQRLEMTIRIFGETLLKDLVRGVHGLVIRHQDEVATVRLRNQWVPIDPREWSERDDLEVAIGAGSVEERRMNLMLMGSIQEKAAIAGVVLPENVYNLSSDIAEQLGFRQEDRYFTNPKNMPPKPPQPNPLIMKAQMDAQSRAQAAQVKAQADIAREHIRAQSDQAQNTQDHQRKALMDAGRLSVESQSAILDFVAHIVAAEMQAKAGLAASAHSDIMQAAGDARDIIGG